MKANCPSFSKTIVPDGMEYAALMTLVEAMLQNIERDNLAGTPKPGDALLYPVYVGLATKLAIPQVPPVN